MAKFNYNKFPKLNKVASDTNSPNRVTLNKQDYLLSIWIDNLTDCIELPVLSIDNLQLTDDFLGFNKTGILRYSTPNFSIERFFSKIGSALGDECEIRDNKEDNDQFVFEGSGSELIHIKFQRIPIDNAPSTKGDLIMQSFIITDVNDSGGLLSNKSYELIFEGIEKAVLKNYRIDEYSCGDASTITQNGAFNLSTLLNEYPKDGDYTKRSEFGADKTGESIYYIMQKTYEDWVDKTGLQIRLSNMLPPIFQDDEFDFQVTTKSENTTTSSIKEYIEPKSKSDVKTVEYILDRDSIKDKFHTFSNNTGQTKSIQKANSFFWDFGSPKSFLYTQNISNRNSWALVSENLNIHTSGIETGAKHNDIPNINKLDPCILRLERPFDEDTLPQITLRPLQTYFSALKIKGNNNEVLTGEGMMGTFRFGSSETIGNPLEFIPKFLESTYCDVKSKESEQPIEDFSFDPTNPETASLLFKTYVAMHTGNKTESLITDKEGLFENVKEYIGQNYVKNLYEFGDSVDPSYLVNVKNNGLKTEDNIFLSTYSNPPTKSAGVALSRNRAIFMYMFMNDSLTFNTEGNINREAGKFLYATTDNLDKEDKVINKLVGFYMCSSITHTISPNGKSFNQSITGVKFYRRPTSIELKVLELNKKHKETTQNVIDKISDFLF